MGYYTIGVLEALERRAGMPLARCFDLLVGTSVGGVIALALAREVAARKIADIFDRHGHEVFARDPPPQSLWEVAREAYKCGATPKYDGRQLRRILTRVLGAKTTFADLGHSVLVTAVCLEDGSPFYFGSPGLPDCGDTGGVRLVDAAMATSAVPGYFPLARVAGRSFVDGGLFAPQPDIQALGVARAKFGRRLTMLSIGTASAVFGEMAAEKANIGNLGWLKQQRLLKLALASGQRATTVYMQSVLGKRYVRLDAAQSLEEQRLVGVDAATDQAKRILGDLAAKTTAKPLPPPLLKMIRRPVG